MTQPIDKTIQVLEELSRCEPRKVRRTGLENKAQVIANWCLGLALFFLVVNGGFVFFYDTRPPSLYAKIFVLLMSTISMLLAISSLVAPMVASFLLAFRWKKLSLEGLCDDIRYEQAMADRLATYEAGALKDAHFWLNRKIRRINERTGRFFGEKTAAIGLLATAYSFTAEFGGFEWVSKTMAAGFRIDNLGNTVLLGVGALLLGMSIGSILLGHIAARYRYQIEIIELVDRS
ncbi:MULTISPECIES: hypothetical protein [Pseudomonas]|uniref:Uncharacterized protein n=1 Tax=Pseudomonas fluorescens TaxID=294 RepID=A0A5E6ULX0_PSEFL|nr:MULTISPECIES: hypothetical protein [Pseudomonas]VVN06347.1 hypothetical protein PS652_03573 [Pseudomonas fluorescens]